MGIYKPHLGTALEAAVLGIQVSCVLSASAHITRDLFRILSHPNTYSRVVSQVVEAALG